MDKTIPSKSNYTRILHLRSSGGMLGAESVILQIAQKSPELGYEIIIGVLHNPDEPEPELYKVAQKTGIACVLFDCPGRLNFATAKVIKSFALTNSISCIHCHGYKEDFYALIASTGLPLVATNHLWKNTTTALKLYSWIDTLCLFFFDRIVAVSHPILEQMKGRGLSWKDPQLISNGVSIPAQDNAADLRLALCNEFGFSADDFIFTVVGSLTAEKGHSYLLRALKDLYPPILNLRLIIVGDGPERNSLGKLVSDFSLESQVKFAGTRRDISNILLATNAFILPSLIEGLPMALLEAMAVGTPVIATRVGDVPLAVIENETGLLVDPCDIKSMAGSMSKLCNDRSFCNQLGASARQRIIAKFSAKLMTERYCNLYSALLEKTK